VLARVRADEWARSRAAAMNSRKLFSSNMLTL
jgi:hypothetical protein